MKVALYCSLLALLIGWNAPADARPDPAEMLQAVQLSGIPQNRLSLLAVEGRSGSTRTLLAVNPRSPKVPASVTKLITAASSLRELPPGTRFETRLLADGSQGGRRLNGNLVLKGGGDPSFVSETLWVLVSEFARTGIREITGDIVVDDSYFDDVRIDPTRDTKRVEMGYDAPVGALSFNWNTVAVYIRPGERVGDPARVILDPASDYIQIRGSINTVPGHSAGSRIVVHRYKDPDFAGDVIKVSGVIGAQAPEVVTYRNITQPDIWAGENLKLFLQYMGIKVNGRVRRGSAGANAHTLASTGGRPIEQIVVDMNKVSSNFTAEMLAKNLAARLTPPGTMDGGMEHMRSYLRELGVGEQEFRLVNPSGLTQMNRLSAFALLRVLQDMGDDFQYQTEFMASLPVAGVDGTLRKRMRRSPARRWVRAKTGYVDGAVTLAGYAGREDGEHFTFAFLYNGPSPAYKVKHLYDELCEIMVSQ